MAEPMAEPALLAYIRSSELGADLQSQTPYGSRPLVCESDAAP